MQAPNNWEESHDDSLFRLMQVKRFARQIGSLRWSNRDALLGGRNVRASHALCFTILARQSDESSRGAQVDRHSGRLAWQRRAQASCCIAAVKTASTFSLSTRADLSGRPGTWVPGHCRRENTTPARTPKLRPAA